jgi:ubiquinone/menaquinone biosynthesis C-methylase UbiE
VSKAPFRASIAITDMQSSIPDWMVNLLICVACGKENLEQHDDDFICAHCNSVYPIVNRVPMFLKTSTMVDAAASIARDLGGLEVRDVQRAFGSALRYRMDDPWLRTEFSNIVERYPVGSAKRPEETTPQTTGHLRLLVDYFNPYFVQGTASFRSFRIRNETGRVLASEGDKPFLISYWLTDSDGHRTEGVRSRFPVPLLPSKDLTVPVLIQVPNKAGDFKIEVMLVQEFVAWDEAAPVYTGVLHSVPSLPNRDLVRTPHNGSFVFELDLEYSKNVMEMAAKDARGQTDSERLNVLEFACGSDPQTLRNYQPNSNVVACDLAFPQVQLAALSWAKRGVVPLDRYAFASADVLNPPFRKNSFDLIIVCAALHHFSDTTAALSMLETLLKPNGKIVLLREPGKMAVDDPTYIKELVNGFNEQQFELAEYDVMYDRAGLAPVYQQLDFECSYKAILRSASPDAHGSVREGS